MWTYRGDEPTVVQWLEAIRVGHEGHRVAAEAVRRRHRALGATAVLLATLAAGASLTSLLADDGAWFTVAAGALAVATAATALLHSFLDDADVIASHERARAEYGDVRRQLEQAILSERITDDRLSEIRADWLRVEEAAPSLSGRASRRAASRVAGLSSIVTAPAAPREPELDEPLKELTAN
ncbi:SLATT domain-containing protein [Mumia quercus]|uniref:SLATT domain-containing protein n=1 Tax=Mumia quercus TaxID=2976125 RepID=UPI0021D2404C|nr:SLATT domain-containing protein [Mumia quercus]